MHEIVLHIKHEQAYMRVMKRHELAEEMKRIFGADRIKHVDPWAAEAGTPEDTVMVSVIFHHRKPFVVKDEVVKLGHQVISMRNLNTGAYCPQVPQPKKSKRRKRVKA